MSRLIAGTIFAALALGSTTAQAQDLTISFPSYRPYYTPSAGTSISFPSTYNLTVAIPWSPPIDVSGGLVVGELPGGGMTIDIPGQPPVDLNPGNFPVIDLWGSTGSTIDFPAYSAPILVFPYSTRAPVALGDATGLTLTNYGTWTVIDFPGTSQPPVWLGYWEALPRIEMPSGGGLVVSLPSGSAPPVDLDPGAALTVEIPKGDTQSFWFYEEAPVWYGWYY